ncbi:hypothetical protein GYMLUDRAFT_47698 [Collybiopsis luxurians FD-317 M1]|uniref:Hydrophobin n=1 Tax=Collybiopsis luxurians FD-317 M1 TaxID=944289 RepID=A0A0D0AY29_9AGAR|nr:hypothetical protein GYMLUDRAFT_47698 [Collybiopsis luxurians FD-317 M1]
MKFFSVLTFALAAGTASVSAAPNKETNGERLARGLPPLPPVRRSGTPVYAAKRTGPSGSPSGSCSTGPVQCCQTVGTESNPVISLILGLLGIVIQDVDTLIGATCSPITVIGGISSGCSAQSVCCEDNSHGGLISIGCVPIQL